MRLIPTKGDMQVRLKCTATGVKLFIVSRVQNKADRTFDPRTLSMYVNQEKRLQSIYFTTQTAVGCVLLFETGMKELDEEQELKLWICQWATQRMSENSAENSVAITDC